MRRRDGHLPRQGCDLPFRTDGEEMCVMEWISIQGFRLG
jgi:hypothetical protein